jgi:hypothetical protein
MYYEKLTKFEIAERQLFHAMELYLAGTNLVSVITLAGAAEEILGKLVSSKGYENALDLKVKKLCKMFEFVFKKQANPKDFEKLRNKARNELKHIGTEDFIELNLEQEAVKMLDRAIKNYKKLNPRVVQKFWEFNKVRVYRHRQQMKAITSLEE